MITDYENKMMTNHENKGAKMAERYFAEMTFHKKCERRPKGKIERIRIDEDGKPIDPGLRKRLKDSEIDGCVSIKQEKKTKPKREKE